MSGKWFTNRGQVIQVALTALALVLAVVVQLPYLRQHTELWDLFPYLLLALFIFGVFQSGRMFGAVASAGKLAIEERSRPSVQWWSPTIRIGDYWHQELGLRDLRITLVRIIPEEPPVAELHFDGGIFHSFRPRPTDDHSGFNTYRLTASRSSVDVEKKSVFAFDLDESMIRFTAIRVDHLNPHTNEVKLCVGWFSASKPSET